MASLENKTKGMIVLNLDGVNHRRTIGMVEQREGKDGKLYPVRVKKNIGDSITLTARGTPGSKVGKLPDSILECTDVKNAHSRGTIVARKG